MGWLHGHDDVQQVRYPGFGGMVSVSLRATLEQTCSVVKSTKVFTLAESLGGVESLIELPALMTHASVPSDVRAGLGIDDGLIRLSVGIEHVDDLIEDLSQAIENGLHNN